MTASIPSESGSSETRATVQPFGGRRREFALVAAIALLALGLRVAHVLFFRDNPYFGSPTMDAAYHLQWARALVAGETFQEGPYFRAPGYVWFLAACLKLSGGSLIVPRLLQAGLGAGTAVLTYLLGKRIFDARVGALASLLAATYWVLIYFDGELLLPALSVPLNLAALLLTAHLTDRPTVRRAGIAGFLWGLAALVRPNVLLLVPCFGLWLLWRRRPAWRAGLPAALFLCGGCLLPILPLTLRNRIVGGDWVLISSQAGVNLWIGNNPSSDGSTAIVPGTRGGWWEGFHDSIALAEAEAGHALQASGVSRHYAGKALDWMLEHPGEALAHQAWKLRLFWSDVELGNNLDVRFFAHRFDPLTAWLPVRFAPLVGLALLGLLLSLRQGSRTFPCWGFLFVYTASVVGFFVCSRFRVPVLPVLSLFAAQGLLWLVGRARVPDLRRLVCGLALVLSVAQLVHLAPAGVLPSRANGELSLGLAASSRGELALAEAHFEAALEAYPNSIQALTGLAQSVRERGDAARAERLLREALQLLERGGFRAPGRPETEAYLVDVLVELERLDEAQRLAAASLTRDPGQPRMRFALARLLLAHQRIPEAIAQLERSLQLDPTQNFVREALIDLLERVGREQDARQLQQELGR